MENSYTLEEVEDLLKEIDDRVFNRLYINRLHTDYTGDCHKALNRVFKSYRLSALNIPFEDLPLYINESLRTIDYITIRWRLKIGK